MVLNPLFMLSDKKFILDKASTYLIKSTGYDLVNLIVILSD